LDLRLEYLNRFGDLENEFLKRLYDGSDQIHAIYGRESALFPPQGLVAGESFFAREGTGSAGRTLPASSRPPCPPT